MPSRSRKGVHIVVLDDVKSERERLRFKVLCEVLAQIIKVIVGKIILSHGKLLPHAFQKLIAHHRLLVDRHGSGTACAKAKAQGQCYRNQNATDLLLRFSFLSHSQSNQLSAPQSRVLQDHRTPGEDDKKCE